MDASPRVSRRWMARGIIPCVIFEVVGLWAVFYGDDLDRFIIGPVVFIAGLWGILYVHKHIQNVKRGLGN